MQIKGKVCGFFLPSLLGLKRRMEIKMQLERLGEGEGG